MRTKQTTTLFGDWLIGRKMIGREDLRRALDEQKRNGGLIGEALQRIGVLSDEELAKAL